MPKLSDGGEPPYYVDEETVNSFGGGGGGGAKAHPWPPREVCTVFMLIKHKI